MSVERHRGGANTTCAFRPAFPARGSLDSSRAANVSGAMSARGEKHVKEYATDEIVVEWEPRLCFHSDELRPRRCRRSSIDDRRPWVAVDAATADEVEAAVARCPSGRAAVAPTPALVRQARPPLDVRASAERPAARLAAACGSLAADGNVLYEGERAALCRCGGSGNKPFCDGTHKKIGFRG